MAGQAREGFFERTGAALGFEGGWSVEGDERALLQNSHAVREEFNLGKQVRSKKNGCAQAGMNFGFEKTAKISRGDGVETARGFVEKKNFGLVQQSAEKAEALESAGGESPDLTVERAAEFETLRKFRNPRLQD